MAGIVFSGVGEPLVTMWQLKWEENRLSCFIYRTPDGLRLSLESPTAVIVSERFELRPRAVARAQALRTSLVRRGWSEDGPANGAC